MAKARRAQAAERDFENIGFQIAVKDGRPEVARRILQELADECDRLAGSTAIEAFGTPAPGIGTDVRLIAFRRWVILFRYQHDGVMILRIADGSQNYLKWKLGE